MTTDDEKRAFLVRAHEQNRAALDRLGEGTPEPPAYTRGQLTYRPEAFVRARLGEAEADAHQVLTENQSLREGGLSSTLWDEQDVEALTVLADVASKRRVLDIIQPDLDAGTQVFSPARDGFEQWGKAYLIACALALPWADHEDFSHKWEREGATP